MDVYSSESKLDGTKQRHGLDFTEYDENLTLGKGELYLFEEISTTLPASV